MGAQERKKRKAMNVGAGKAETDKVLHSPSIGDAKGPIWRG